MKLWVLQETNTKTLLIPLSLFSETKDVTSHIFLAIGLDADML
jgi:hypothetical protein